MGLTPYADSAAAAAAIFCILRTLAATTSRSRRSGRQWSCPSRRETCTGSWASTRHAVCCCTDHQAQVTCRATKACFCSFLFARLVLHAAGQRPATRCAAVRTARHRCAAVLVCTLSCMLVANLLLKRPVQAAGHRPATRCAAVRTTRHR
jgi:hypothetical protein